MGLILIIAVIGFAYVLLVQQRDGGSPFSPAATTRTTVAIETSLEILNKRYARGEIDRAEYEERRQALES
ncbi:MAG: SHOCT domain-containing protein [Thermoleophilia bacterium]